MLKASDGHGSYWTKSFALADDFEDADAKKVLTFYQAQDAAKRLARGEDGSADSAPITVEGALKDYRRDLEARNANPYNAEIAARASDEGAARQAGATTQRARVEEVARWPARQDRARHHRSSLQMPMRRLGNDATARRAHPEPAGVGKLGAGRFAGCSRGAQRHPSRTTRRASSSPPPIAMTINSDCWSMCWRSLARGHHAAGCASRTCTTIRCGRN